MSRESNKLQQLVQVLNTGSEFYWHLKQRLDDDELQSFLDANLTARERLLDKLQTLLLAKAGTAEQGTDLASQLEEHRADLEAVLNENSAYVYLDYLVKLEHKAQQALREAVSAAESTSTRSLLQSLEPVFDQMYMHALAAKDVTTNREVPKTLPTRMMR